MAETRPTAIDLFCGCGAFSLGMIQAGFEVVAAIDNNVMALATYYANLCAESTKIIGDIPRNKMKHFTTPDGWRTTKPAGTVPPPVSAIFYKDIMDVNGWDLLNGAGIESVDLVVGSPPCQSFSKCNTNKKENDSREFLMFEYARMILEINPKTFMLENVPQVETSKIPDGRNLLDVFKRIIDRRDWELYYEIQGMYPNADLCPQTNKGNQCSIGEF